MTVKSINEVCMVVSFSASRWAARKQDRRITAAAAKAHNASEESITGSKKLFDSPAFRELERIINDARREHYRLTLPWGDRGERLLANDVAIEYFQKMDGYIEEVENRKSDLKSEFEEGKAKARQALGDLYSDDDYPRPDQIDVIFKLAIDKKPVPEKSDIRLQALSDEMVEEFNREREAKIKEAVNNAIRDVYERVAERLEHMVERLEKEDASFHKTMMEHVNDLADLLPRLNFMGDPGINALAREIKERLCKYDTETLKADRRARGAAAKDAKELLEKAQGYL